MLRCVCPAFNIFNVKFLQQNLKEEQYFLSCNNEVKLRVSVHEAGSTRAQRPSCGSLLLAVALGATDPSQQALTWLLSVGIHVVWP